MYCKYCGAALDDDSVFCNKCGKKLIMDEQHVDSHISLNHQHKANKDSHYEFIVRCLRNVSYEKSELSICDFAFECKKDDIVERRGTFANTPGTATMNRTIDSDSQTAIYTFDCCIDPYQKCGSCSIKLPLSKPNKGEENRAILSCKSSYYECNDFPDSKFCDQICCDINNDHYEFFVRLTRDITYESVLLHMDDFEFICRKNNAIERRGSLLDIENDISFVRTVDQVHDCAVFTISYKQEPYSKCGSCIITIPLYSSNAVDTSCESGTTLSHPNSDSSNPNGFNNLRFVNDFSAVCIVCAIFNLLQIYFWSKINALSDTYSTTSYFGFVGVNGTKTETHLITEMLNLEYEWFSSVIITVCIISAVLSFIAVYVKNRSMLIIPIISDVIMCAIVLFAPAIYDQLYTYSRYSPTLTTGSWISIALYVLTLCMLIYAACIHSVSEKH